MKRMLVLLVMAVVFAISTTSYVLWWCWSCIAGWFAWAGHAHAYLSKSPDDWMKTDLNAFLRWIIPVLAITHTCLTIVMYLQQRTQLQRALTRFLAAKAFFWGVFWLAFHIRQTRLWSYLDFVVLLLVAITTVDVLYCLIRRYVFVRRPAPVPATLAIDDIAV